jgi:tellurite resistance protein
MSLGLLVGRFGQFVREQHEAPALEAGPEVPFPDDLARLRGVVSHHVIPLALLARADGDFAQSERQAILDHCLALLEDNGTPASDADRAALEDYIATFRPSLMQLDPALKRLEREPPETVAAMFAAATAVIEADGRCDPAQARLIAEMREELSKLHGA